MFSQLEKTRLVKKRKAARDRKRPNGKVEGRKSHLEAQHDDLENRWALGIMTRFARY